MVQFRDEMTEEGTKSSAVENGEASVEKQAKESVETFLAKFFKIGQKFNRQKGNCPLCLRPSSLILFGAFRCGHGRSARDFTFYKNQLTITRAWSGKMLVQKCFYSSLV